MISCDNKYKLGLIGHPISHSRSPVLFRETFAERPDVLERYSYDLIEEADFDAAFGRFMSEYLAVNVTAPFKTKAFQAADVCSEEARLCGATNLLVKETISAGAEKEMDRTTSDAIRERGQDAVKCAGSVFAHDVKWAVKAYNTDCLAVKKILLDAGFGAVDVAHVYGCGGAGRAAAVAALMLGMRVRIYNRTLTTAKDFAESVYSRKNELVSFGNLSIAERWTDTGIPCDTSCKEVIIYTLPVAPSAFLEGSVLPAWQQSLHGKLVLEANYKNAHLDPGFPQGPVDSQNAVTFENPQNPQNPEFTKGADNAKTLESVPVSVYKYISGLEWLRLQALETYRVVMGDI